MPQSLQALSGSLTDKFIPADGVDAVTICIIGGGGSLADKFIPAVTADWC